VQIFERIIKVWHLFRHMIVTSCSCMSQLLITHRS
jgi:hypothetical protein